MSDKMRWRYGETNPVNVKIDKDVVVEIGDLVYKCEDKFIPASLISTNNLSANFLGVAMQRSRKGEEGEIRVATSGTFEYGCATGPYSLGQEVGPVPFDHSQIVCKNYHTTIGIVDKEESELTQSVLVRISSAYPSGV